MTPTFAILLTTFPAEGDADGLARLLVGERLAACVNILPPMRSIYRWQGAIDSATECQIVIKTTADRVEALKTRLLELHPYELPEILVLPISGGGEAYLKWIADSTSI